MDAADNAPEQPQLYLVTPPTFELSSFPDRLARVLDEVEAACLRLSLASSDQDVISRAADAVRAVAHERDIALVITDHIQMAERLGLDGVHLGDAARSVRDARKALGADAIVGCYCGPSRHDGMTAGEAGADYISFGPVGQSALGDGSTADLELFQWWSEMIEIPVVAEGNLTPDLVASLAPYTDFFGIGDEIWRADDALAELKVLTAALR